MTKRVNSYYSKRQEAGQTATPLNGDSRTPSRRAWTGRRRGIRIVVVLVALLSGGFGPQLVYASHGRPDQTHATRSSSTSVHQPVNQRSQSTARPPADLRAMRGWDARANHLNAESASLRTEAQQRHTLIVADASPLAARNPNAVAPTAPLHQLAVEGVRIQQWEHQVRRLQDQVTAHIAAAPPHQAKEVRRLLRQVQADAQAVQSVAVAIHQWVNDGNTAVRQFQQVHDASPGVLGVDVRNTDADWTVHGCMVTDAIPGGTASAMGLIGSMQRTDPVGDVITAIRDVTDANQQWTIPNCAALTQALAWTRPGDRIVISYDYRQVVWYELNGTWIPESAAGTLGPSRTAAACPAPITGTITSPAFGSRINLTITLAGPKSTRSGIQVILDTGGVEDYFPNTLLQNLGFVPFQRTTTAGIVPGASATAYLYHVPGTALEV